MNFERAILWIVGVLIFVWPIPNTTPVRYNLIAVLVVMVGISYARRLDIRAVFANRATLFFSSILLVTTIWFYIVAFFLSDYTVHSLSELNSQWLLSVGCFFLGLLLANTITSKRNILLSIFIAVFLHIVYISSEAAWLFAKSGEIQDNLEGLIKGKDRANVFTNIAIAILLGEIFFRSLYHKNILPLKSWFIGTATAIAFLSLFFEGARLGILGVFFMLFTIAILALYISRHHKSSVTLFAIVLVASVVSFSLLAANIKYDKRWANIFETVETAMDIEKNKGWIEADAYPLPTLKDGTIANDSNYKRPAWIAAGISFIAESPWGNGFARDAFGRYKSKKYGEGKPNRAAHSSLIDFGVGGGVIAIVGWMAFLIGLSFVGFRGFIKRQNYYSLLLFFLAGGFFFRMCVDSIARDHMLEQFMFLAGLFLAFVTHKDEEVGAKTAFV